MSEIEGLCDSDYWSRNGIPDHWKGYYTRRSPKGKVEVAWNHVSPSQIENFIKCKRLWFYKSIQKLEEAQKGHQSLGEAFHLVMEKVPKGLPWPSRADVSASSEEWDKADAMAKQALPLLPAEPKDKPFKREHGIRLETYEGGPTMVGYIDLGIPSGVGWPSFLFPANEAIVADYKTLSDFRYMKTPQELADSVQMMTYAKWAIEAWPLGLHGQNDPMPDHVRLLHMYARTKPPFGRTSIRHESAIVTPSEINTRWNKTLDIVREMQQTSSCTDSNDVEAGGALNGHCDAYGGCHFRDKCGISKTSGIKNLFSIGKKPTPTPQEPNDMSGSAILDKIKAARANAGLPATTAPTATPTSQSAANSATGPTGNPVVNPSNAEASANSPSGALGAASSPTSGIQTPSGSLTPNVSPVAPKGPVSGLMARIQSQGKGAPMLTGSMAQAYSKEQGIEIRGAVSGSGELGKTSVATLGELMKLAQGVVPPDAPAREQPVITQPGDKVVDPTKVIEGDDEDGDEEGDESDGTTIGAIVSAPETPSAGVGTTSTGVSSGVPGSEVKKRGRPSREEMAAREQAQRKAFEDAVNAEVAKRVGNPQVSSQGENVASVVQERNELDRQNAALRRDLADYANRIVDLEKANQDLIAHVQPAKEGLTLYVDCFPTKGDREVTDFFEWIGPIVRQVADANNVGDWRQINYTAKALLANAIRETVKAEGLPKALAVSSYAGGADVALEILIPIAKKVIKKL